jgi:hypothetical protein
VGPRTIRRDAKRGTRRATSTDVRLAIVAAILGGTLVISASSAMSDPRPSSISMGVSATAEGAPFNHGMLGLPVSIDAGTLIDGEIWWHATASFGAANAPEEGDGHTFELRTGPRVQHCWGGRFCVGAGVEAGWGHSRWDISSIDGALSYDDVHVEARVRAAVALSSSGLVLLEISGGPRARYYLRASDEMGPIEHIDEDVTRGGALGIALVVRN